MHRVESEPPTTEHLYFRQIAGRESHGWGGTRTQGGADWHGRDSACQVGHAQRTHEQAGAVFAQCRISGDDGDDETVQDDIQDDHSAYYHWFHVAELVGIHDETPYC